jgi:hypothetical protein
MDHKELVEEEKRLTDLLKQKQKEVANLTKKAAQHNTKDISKAGNADGRVDQLTEKWTQCCQQVLLQLQQKAKTPTTLQQMLAYFQLEPSLVRYNPDTDGF